MAKNINILLRSKILVAVVMAILFTLGLVQLAQGLINTEYYRAHIQQTVKEQTGKDLVIKGAVSVALLPIPTLYLPGVELRSADNNVSAPLLMVDMVYLRSSIGSALSGDPKIESIILERPSLEIERSEDNQLRLDWLNKELLRFISRSSPVAVEVLGGKVLYRNMHTDKDFLVEKVEASVITGAQPQAAGSFSMYGHILKFDVGTKASLQMDAAFPATFKLSANANDHLTFDGIVDISGEEMRTQGKLALQIEDMLLWTKPEIQEKGSLLDQITHETIQKEQKQIVLPLSLSGDWEQTGALWRLTNAQLTGMNSAAGGTWEVAWDDIPRTTITMNFSALGYDQWKMLSDALQDGKDTLQAIKEGMSQKKNPLPGNIALTVNLDAEKMYVGHQIWNKTHISATLDKAAVTINQFHAMLPSDVSLSLFGIVSAGGTGGLRFEGSMETQGPNLRELLTAFDESALDLPGADIGSFKISSNLYVASDQVRLSEADAQISDLHLNGGLVAYFDASPRVEADVKLKDINFDYFRDNWRKKQGEHKENAFFLKYDKNTNFNWLNQLRTSIDFRVKIDRFTFLDRKGDSASFQLFAKAGEFGLYNVHLYYPGETMEASLSLDAKGEKPTINLLLNAGEINADYFSPNPNAPPSPPLLSDNRQWSEELIDMSWMEGINGTFDISAGKLRYYDKMFDSFKLRAKFENNSVTFQSLSFNYWQGKCSITGSMYGGTVPGISVGFTLYNADVQEMLQSLIGRDNIGGKVSISGTLATSGVNALSWVSQAAMELVVAGRGVGVNHFNLQGVTNAVTASRTAADVVNNVNIALGNGSTDMSVDGNINIKNGVMRTPGITLKTDTVTGNLTGEVKLVPWTMQLSSLYQFPALTSETVPTMTVQLTGSIDTPEMQVDTALLEAYVSKRIIGGSVR